MKAPFLYLLLLCAVCNASYAQVYVCDSVYLADSIHACKNTAVHFNPLLTGTDSVISISWVPAAGLSDSAILNPLCNVGSVSTMYHLTVQSLIPDELVVNGDFSQGNTGFTSSYAFVSGPNSLVPESVYAISTNPLNEHAGAASFGDHTTGTGNMMAINGASSPVDVWCENITVTPNTYYDFSAWFANWSSDSTLNLPQIQFEINGTLIGALNNFPSGQGLWVQFFSTWYSGANTSITICINDQQTAPEGNDFAIDDISFEPVCMVSDSVYVAVSNLNPLITASPVHCADQYLFTVSDSGNSNTSFIWNFGDNTTDSGSSISHTYATNGTYNIYVKETDDYGCKDSAGVSEIVTPFIPLSITPDTSVCGAQHIQLNATGADSAYVWMPAAGLNNAYIGNPIAAASATVKYIVTGVDSGGCHGTDSVTITVNAVPVVKVTGDSSICYGQSDQLNASGADTYSWLPQDNISNAAIADPLVQPAEPVTYIVTGTDAGGCTGKDSINIDVKPLPVLTVSVNGSVSCSDTAVQLSVSGATTYTWSPAEYVVNADIHSPAPFASPPVNTIFWVTGVDNEGCSNQDSLTVISAKSAAVYMPNAFTPNNDGLDDVIYPKVYCDLILDRFSVYNRWGQRVFTTSTEGMGWDGKVNGVPQSTDTFDYLIKGHRKSNGKSVFYKGDFTLLR